MSAEPTADVTGREPDTGPAAHCTIDELLAAARAGVARVSPEQIDAEQRAGALVVDIRSAEQRERDGPFPGAVVIDRNVLEWRLDPASPQCIAGVAYDRRIIVVCDQGYSSSLAAASLRALGLRAATDLIDGFQGWLIAVRDRDG